MPVCYGNVAGVIHPPNDEYFEPAIVRCPDCGREWPAWAVKGKCPDCLKYDRAKRELRSWRAKDAWRRKHG